MEQPPKCRLLPSAEYFAKRKALEGERLREVEWAEQDIAEDPDHLHWRWQTSRGTMLDYSAANSGSIIEYHRDSRRTHKDEVHLVDLIDLTDPSIGNRSP